MIDDTKVHILSHPMSPDVKRNITIENWLLITHNAFRALVAKGYATANREIVLPYAANMNLMVKTKNVILCKYLLLLSIIQCFKFCSFDTKLDLG